MRATFLAAGILLAVMGLAAAPTLSRAVDADACPGTALLLHYNSGSPGNPSIGPKFTEIAFCNVFDPSAAQCEECCINMDNYEAVYYKGSAVVNYCNSEVESYCGSLWTGWAHC